jgi:AraC family transcriptional regulator
LRGQNCSAEFVYRVRRAARAHPLLLDETIYAPGQVLPRHAHPRPILIAFLEGRWLHSVDRETRYVRPGDVAFLPAQAAHALRFVGRVGRAFSVEFEGAALQSALPTDSLHTSDPRLLAVLLHTYWAFARDRRVDGDVVGRMLVDALLAVDARRWRSSAGSVGSWLSVARARMQLVAPETVRMATLAREVGINPAHMSRRFREVFGESMSELRERVRIEHASRALMAQTASISAIAAELGFSDHAHLTRAFRRATHMTPSAFRRVIAETALSSELVSSLHSPRAFRFHSSIAAGIRVV